MQRFAGVSALASMLTFAATAPSQAQDAAQPIVLHCVHNENEALDLVIDLARNSFSYQTTLTNLNGPGSTFTAPSVAGPLESVSVGQVDFTGGVEREPYTLNRYTGMLTSPRYGSFKCARSEKVF